MGSQQITAALRAHGIADLRLRFDEASAPATAPTRVSFFSVGSQIHSAAITATTTVTERVLELDVQLVRETVERISDSGSALAPSLADELFRRGVQDYIGTAWTIDDVGAVLFAETLYDRLLADPGTGRVGTTIGEAVLQARQELARNQEAYGALWAAYQHYGDPRRTIRRGGGASSSAP